MKATILTILALIVLAGCKQGEPVKNVTNSKDDFAVQLLFEVDGCKVYRFTDYRTVYFSDCRGKIESTYTTRSGKTTTTHQQDTLNN